MKTNNYVKLLQYLTILSALLLVSCGGGGGGGTASSPTVTNLVATAVKSTAPLSECPNGGITVEGGIDSNGNNVLDPSEVTSTQYVCNGGNGLTTLVLISDEPLGANCATGGKKVEAGQDNNSNSILDPAEVTSTGYVCNGMNGSNGLNSLMTIVSDPDGYCTYGGNKVSSGVDNNPTNGVLDPAEVTASNYVCNGAPGPAGPGVTWVNITASAVQAESNTGYLANSAVQVTITLPPTPAVGDVVQVSGIGTGGWKIAQNAGQSIITRDIPGGNVGETWVPRGATRNWSSVASSADGSKLVATEWNGLLYTSTDSGLSWRARDAARSWSGVASSSDGTKLVAAVNSGQLYTSADAGVTWTARESPRQWFSVASSADGTNLVAAAYGDQLYTSTNAGVSWTARDAVRGWLSVASSADGTKLIAAAQSGQLYTSTDSGQSWTAREAVRSWLGVASSSDGTKLVAVAYNSGLIYTSTDSGVSWAAQVASTTSSFGSVASSADGTKLVAAGHWNWIISSQIYTSADAGLSWKARDTSRGWGALASSADGNKLVAAVWNGQLYTSTMYTTPGTTGSISGVQYDAVDLQCVDINTFMVRSHAGYLVVQ